MILAAYARDRVPPESSQVLTYDETVSQLLFGLMETLMLQSAPDPEVRKESRRLAWQCLHSWSARLDRSVHTMGNLAYDLEADAETFWRKYDMVVLIARLRAREEEFARWGGERPAD
jgi:hypothetical protein